MDDFQRILRHIQRRFFIQSLLSKLAVCLLAGAAVQLALLAWFASRHEPLWNVLLTGGIALVSVVGAMLWTWITRLTPVEAAMRIDSTAGTRDRFLTALAFSRAAHPEPLKERALAECAAFVARFDPRPWTRLRLPREAKFLAIPLLAMALLTWHVRLAEPRWNIDPATDARLRAQADELRQMAEQIEKQSRDQPSPDLERLAQQLRESAAKIDERNQDTRSAEKAALSQLSKLEAAIRSVQRFASAEELAALAAALKAVPQANDAAEALQAGNLAEAATQLERLAKNAGDEKEAREMLERALQEARERMKQESELRQQIAALLRDSTVAEALRQLAESLRQQGGQTAQQRGGSGGRPDPDMLKNLLQALQNLKAGQQNVAPSLADSGTPGQTLPVAMESFADPSGKGDSGTLGLKPSGQPGSELDPGTSDTPFGPRNSQLSHDGPSARLTGVLGEGESLQELVTAAGDESTAQRRYRDLYNAIAPAAEDTVLNENIPLGSRFFVKRYFESIRPGQ